MRKAREGFSQVWGRDASGGNIVSPIDTTRRSREQTHQGVAASTQQAHGCLVFDGWSEWSLQ